MAVSVAPPDSRASQKMDQAAQHGPICPRVSVSGKSHLHIAFNEDRSIGPRSDVMVYRDQAKPPPSSDG